MRSTECGMRSVECGIDVEGHSLPEASPDIPHSAFRIPHLSAGALMLALLSPPVGAQQRDSVSKDTATLAPVVVTGVRPPSVRGLAARVTGRTATVGAAGLGARGGRCLAGALP